MSDDRAEKTRRFVEEKVRRASELEVSAATFFRSERLAAASPTAEK